MKEFVGHEGCPTCGSTDNVGVWSDGQKYCFGSCGYFVAGSHGLSLVEIRERLTVESKRDHTGSRPVALPIDYSLVLRDDAAAWLVKYGITDQERMRYGIGWSDLFESLVLPAYDISGNLLLFQRRYFGSGTFPKYHTRGFPEAVIWTAHPRSVGNRGDPSDTFNGTLVLVEDYISALKVGRNHECSPLWGSSLSLGQIKRLSNRWEHIIFWLDFNKTKESMKYRYQSSPYFNAAWVVSTEKDPKEYSDGQITDLILACSEERPPQ